VIWSRPFGSGKQYGVYFNDQGRVEELIVDELKLRRKKEAAEIKKQSQY